MAAEVDEEGALTLPAKKLSEIARELPPARRSSSTAAGEQRVTLECGTRKFKLLGPAEGRVSRVPVRASSTMPGRSPAKDLQKLIRHVAFAVSAPRRAGPILNGVLWELRTDRMRMVATNGHRLARMEVPLAGERCAARPT